jgi:hypothetical protein
VVQRAHRGRGHREHRGKDDIGRIHHSGAGIPSYPLVQTKSRSDLTLTRPPSFGCVNGSLAGYSAGGGSRALASGGRSARLERGLQSAGRAGISACGGMNSVLQKGSEAHSAGKGSGGGVG